MQFGAHGIVELKSDTADEAFGTLTREVAELVSDPRTLGLISDLAESRKGELSRISFLLPLADRIDQVREEIRLGLYRKTCMHCG